MKKKLLTFVILVSVSFLAIWIFKMVVSPNPVKISGKIKVAASFYPLSEFARQVGNDNVQVRNIVPAGSEPHEFEATPNEIAEIYSAHIFLINGSGMDPWAEKITQDLTSKGVVVINMSDQVDVISGDPHFWLDPSIAQKEIEVIRDTLIAVDPNNEKNYQGNSYTYLDSLKQLDNKYSMGLSSCTMKVVVISHATIGYLAKRYNFSQIAITGLSPEEEPSPKRMGEIADLARQKNVKYIFFETLVSPKLSQTIADEIGARTLVFNPLEGLTDEEINQGKNYLTVMEENLLNLREAMLCQ